VAGPKARYDEAAELASIAQSESTEATKELAVAARELERAEQLLRLGD
jgi:hypothetical protein